ncbi:CNNM domain-containing protein [Methylothermus subterraneus]
MDDLPLGALFSALAVLIFLSAFFSGSETALMAINRYRLQHLVKQKHKSALRVQKLLERPDRLIGLILLGNNFVNILASSLATVIALRLYGEAGIAAAAGILTLLVLIFGEVAPKTLAALYPERVAFSAAWILPLLLKLFYPLVWLVNLLANCFLFALGIRLKQAPGTVLSTEELRTVVAEAGALLPERFRNMLLTILDLESATVEDVMIPRQDIQGIDLDDPLETVLEQIKTCPHTHLPVFKQNLDHVVGVLCVRKLLLASPSASLTKETLCQALEEAYFVPESMPLHQALADFKQNHKRFALVVDEYGDVQGLVTLEDILQELIGELTGHSNLVQKQADGSYLVDASISLRELNRLTGWNLPTSGPKTLNGLIMEHLETIPNPGTSLKLNGFQVEILEMEGNAVKKAKFYLPESMQPAA